ncbi:NAD(P)-binding protein [Melanomma pulvis-pyrius CBS 109.77]|uniref:NAD(P)-binding protein n=1 Tax=Melanomma pulvis-pyrius CBS 109.77 TaxID=1314802 RepID=A0A6A6XJX1_9PLEO|nr:NAD(P)-binding protein [Melanomma pulvis-pyrius CBS 109.77]
MASRKVGIVTGGASGIGLALTKHLVSRNYRVVIADIDITKSEAVARELGNDILAIQCDVSNWESQSAMFEKAFQWGGHLDFFAANAGVEEKESLYALPDDLEPKKPSMATIEVDLLGVIYGLKLYRHYVRKSGTDEGGKMVVTASMAGLYPMYVAPLYCAAKSGAVGLTQAVGLRLRSEEKITVNCICPGPVDTGISPGMQKLVPNEHMTPMSCVIKAFDKFIDEDVTGQIAECSGDKIWIRERLPYSDDTAQFLNQDMLNSKKFGKYYKRGPPKETVEQTAKE